MLRKTFALAALGMLLTFGAAPVSGQTYPSKPVKFIVGFAPGGGTDIVARLLAQKLTEAMGQPFVVDNRPGATGMIGAKAVATAPADGYTLLMGHVNSQAIAPALVGEASIRLREGFRAGGVHRLRAQRAGREFGDAGEVGS